MRIAGFLLLLAGWVIVMSAVALLPAGAPRGGFSAAGVAVQALGLVLALRSHVSLKGERW